jgi:hypothetical protein
VNPYHGLTAMGFFKICLSVLTLLSFRIAADDSLAGNFFKKDPRSEKNQEMNCCPKIEECCPSYCSKFAEFCSSLPVGGDIALALDYFRSLPDGSWAGNSGAFANINLAIGISKEKYGVGAQLGGSYGLYDWDGRGSNLSGNSKALQQQAFVTAGLFRMTPSCSGVNVGIVYDLMVNKQFGVFGLNPIIGQLRGQFGYLIQGGNEIGVWSAVDTQTSHEETSQIPVRFRAISQVNLFWIHYFKNCAQTMLWAGTPYQRGLMFSSGRAGNYIFGASFIAPLTRVLSIMGHGCYMGAHSGTAFQESSNYAANICFGLNYSFGSGKAGQRPYLSLANNSNFLVDTNINE